MTDTIRITDLRQPEFSDLQRMALDYGESLDVDLTVDSIMTAAGERTGLTDTGDDSGWSERLGLWLGEVGGDPDRTGIGRLSLRNACVRYVANRLLTTDLLARHPEIHDIEIVRPIIIVGLPRTGTTHLLNIVSADDRLRSMPLWESYEPIARRGDGPGVDGIDPRYLRCAHEWDQMQATTPLIAAMHPMEPEHVHEEIELMLPDFASYNLEWVARAPRWRDHYLSEDQTPHYEYMRTMLKVLTWMRPRDRWVLKSPQHFEQLGPLLTTFPDATIVMTHRDPVSVVQSAATMMTYSARMTYRTIDPEWYVDYWTDRIERLLSAAVRDLHLIPSDRRIDVYFDRFMADDVGTVERIFDAAGHEMTKAARRQIDARLADRVRGKHGQVVYDLRADFDRRPDEVRARFGAYLDTFDVPVEVV
jgi:hypothetical protein